MGFIKNLVAILLGIGFVVGLIFFIDEITMVFPFLTDMGVEDRFLGDWTLLHDILVDCGIPDDWHHWNTGILMMLGCGVGLLYTFKKVDD